MTAPATLDLTPTWAGLLPALFAMLESGKGEGPAIARQELARLAAWADSHNAAAKEERAKEEAAKAAAGEALAMARACLAAYPAADLAPGMAQGAVKLRAMARDLRDSLEALAAFYPVPLAPLQAAAGEALARLNAPTYGDSDNALDNAGEARAILESALAACPAPDNAAADLARYAAWNEGYNARCDDENGNPDKPTLNPYQAPALTL